ncbi:MAG: lamin tail domain-containing protein, partial [Thermoguttaceae bacterium]
MNQRSCKRSATRRRVFAQRRRPAGARFWQHRRLRLEPLEARCLLSLNPILSEVAPANSTGIVDTLGDTADWLEIYNPDPQTAVNLSGWSIYYAKTNSTTTHTWTFPSNVVLGPGEFRVIFCDSNLTASELSAEDAVGELDTGFNLSKDGATVELLDTSSAVISSLTYPALNSDTSYGSSETVTETDVVAAGATASYYAPTNGTLVTTGTSTTTNWTLPGFTGATNWASGPTGLGFANTVPGFATTLYKANIAVGSVQTAETIISTPSDQTSVINKTESVLNFLDTGGDGHFGNDNPFPGMSVGEGLTNYVVQATGTLTITSAQAGYYTFGVNSAEGFSLTITGANFSHGVSTTTCSGGTMAYNAYRTTADTLATTYLAAGSYPLSLVYFQGTSQASLEFYAAKESSSAGVSSFDANSILVGSTSATTAGGGTSTTTTPLAVTSTPFIGGNSNSGEFAAAVATNVKPAIQAALAADGNAGTSLYTRITFSDSASLSTLTLKMQYDDGYVAYLNGVEIASENVPGSPTWNSPANEEQTSDVQATTYEDVDVSKFLNSSTTGHLTATGNVLAIQVLLSAADLSSPTDGDMLVVPELGQITSVIGGDHVFSTPTPGAANALGDTQPDIAFSTTHGMFYAPFQVTLTPDIPSDSIYYTTDNTAPVEAIAGITHSGTTATVTTVDPVDFDTGDYVQIANASPAVYDGDFPITVSTTYTSAGGISTFTYTLPSTPASNASNVAGENMIAARGTLCSGPITISTTTELQAVMVDAAGDVGTVQCESYVFPAAVATQSNNPGGSFPTVWNGTINGEDVAADYAMSPVAGYTTQQVINALSSLSTMSIVTSNTNMFGPLGLYSNSDNHNLEYPASFEYFNPIAGTTDFGSLVGLSMYGGVGRDAQYLKHGMQVSFDQSDGASLMPENIFGDGYLPDGLILRQAFNDGWSWGGASTAFIHDQWVRDALTALGTQNTPGIWVQLFVNGQYWGLYNAVANIDSDYAAYFFGGQKSDYDVYHYASDGFEVKSGSMTPWTDLFNVATHGNVAGTGTASPTVLANPAAYALMSQYLNLPAFCDYIIVNYYAGNLDWDTHNYSAVYSPSLGFVFQDWDGEMTLFSGWNGSPDVNVTADDNTGDPTQLFVQLLANPDFRQMFADHVYEDLSTALSPTTAAAMYQKEANTISQPNAAGTFGGAIIDEAARWGNLGELAQTWNELGTPATWSSHIATELGSWFPVRTAEMFTQFATPVTFTPAAGGGTTQYTYTMYPSFGPPTLLVNGTVENGGTILPGASLTMTMTAPAGALIYYTTDGSDPRASGGGVGATAVAYSGAITLTQGEEIKARVLSGITWSALNDSVFYLNLAPSIRVSEVMFDPVPATQAEINAGYTVSDTTDPNKDFQYIEIENIGTATVPVGGLQISGGIDFTFPQYEGNVSTNPLLTLGPGDYMVAVADLSAFTIRYGAELAAEFGSNWQNLIVAGPFSDHHLNDNSDEVELTSPNGGVIEDFTYQSSWYPQTHGGGSSLEVRSASESSSLLNSSAGWEPSGTPNGTPGTAETVVVPLPGSIVVNEVMSNPAGVPGDMIEFYNTTSQPINIGGWYVSNNSSDLMEYEIAAGTVIAANGYYVLTQDYNFGPPATSDPGRLVPFSLDPDGDTVYLSNNYNGQPGQYQEQQAIPAMPGGYSCGLYTKSDGSTDFTLLETPSFGSLSGTTYSGAANSVPYVSPLVIDELMYNPSQPTAAEAAAGYTDADDFEYLELYNRSGTTQTLSDYYIGSGVGFTFGWAPDGTANESETLESGATATWTTTALAAGTYTVYADYSLTDPDGNTRTVDDEAQYTLTYPGCPGGSASEVLDQSTAVNGQLDLGTITVSGPGQVQVQLLRQSTAKETHWTLANQVEFVKTGVDLKVGSPALTSFATSSGITTLAPGGYVLLVSDLQAFDFRHGSGLPVAGEYTGHQSNGGELMSLDQFGPADPATGYIPSYAVDLVDYSDAAPWPTQPDGNGPALIRVHMADYGNDPANWMASGDGPVTNVGGNAGAASLTLDPLPPTVPTNLAAQATLSPSEISLTWTASTDTRSDVAYYDVYRDGTSIGTSQTNSYVDATVQVATNYTYTVSAVNRDGYASAQSAAIVAALPGVTSCDWLDSQDMEVFFSEPLNPATAAVLANYSMSGGIALSAVALSRSNTKVTVTTKTAVTAGNAYTLTMSGLSTASGNPLPASLTASATYQVVTGEILDQVWDNLDSGTTINDLTSPPLNPDYPNDPTYTSDLTSFEAPYNTGVSDYGQRVQGYLYPPTTGNYVFWIASDDNSQLWLSTTSSPANAVEIASVSSWTSYREWTTYSSQQSAAIPLVAGQRYYIEALMKQAGVGDNLSVAWMPPGGTSVPILGSALSVTKLTSSAGTATATLSAAPGFAVGQSVLVSGAAQTAYNGTVVVTAVSGNTFSYAVSGSPASPATGTITVQPYGISYSGTTAYVWLPGNGYSTGDWIDIAGASPTAYDGLNQIASLTANTFSYTLSSTPTGTATGTVLANKILPIPGADLSPLLQNVDLTPPAAPANLRATLGGNNTQVTLNWSPATDLTSGIGDYQIYRDGTAYATSTTTSYTDTSNISSLTPHTYQVAAVNYDGVAGAESAPLTVGPPGIASIGTSSAKTVWVNFSEPVTSASARTIGNYSITGNGGATITAAALQSDGYTVALTTSTALSGSGSYTLTAGNLATPVGAVLPTTSGTFTYVAPGWNVAVYEANNGLSDTIAAAQALVSTPSEQSWVKTEVAPYINYMVSGSDGHFTTNRTLPGTVMGTETDNFAVTATGTLVIPTTGTYTFGVNSEDGFSLTITGATFNSLTNATNAAGTNTLQYNGGHASSDTLGVVTLAAGNYPISLLWFQGVGGAECEVFAAPSSYTAFSTSPPWELVGDTTNGGLAIAGALPTPWCTTTVNPLGTNDPRPALSGTVSASTAVVTARVAGVYYATTNNNNGGWTLPEGDIQPGLAAGTYNVTLFACNGSGQTAFDNTVNQLQIATVAPVASIPALTPNPRNTPVSSLSIQFNEPVSGFDLQNLQLTLNGISTPLGGATLTPIDNPNGTSHGYWTLGNLGGLTAAQGTYALSLTPAGWGVADQYGNLLTTNAATTWVMDTTPPTAIVTTAPPTINAAGAGSSSTTLTVTYADSGSGINPASLSA